MFVCDPAILRGETLEGMLDDIVECFVFHRFNGLYKAEVIHRLGPWRNLQAVEMATLEWVGWFNNRRLFGHIGNIPPDEAEAAYYSITRWVRHRGVTQAKQPPEPGAVHSIMRKA